MCPHSECPCVSLVVLMIQALFELKRGELLHLPCVFSISWELIPPPLGDDALPLVMRFYPAGPVPFPVLHLTAMLLTHMKKLPEARDLLDAALYSPSLLPSQRCTIMDILATRIVPPLHGREAALEMVSRRSR